jgi:hypothetical protein
MAQLVQRHPPPDPCLEREVVKLGPRRWLTTPAHGLDF